mmetsp:Transcript_20047/g.40627  ORF Transcript_20047/g.40627 Transcript_20047/m.40627 type:complete len:256 (-) Transcript_20047:61-828(-)
MCDKSSTTGDENAAEPLLFVRLASRFPIITVLPLIGTASSLVVRHSIARADIVFAMLFPAYLFAANAFRFQWNLPARLSGRASSKSEPLLLCCIDLDSIQVYVAAFAIVGLLLPGAVMIVGPAALAELAAPHLFILLCQIIMECLTDSPLYHIMVRLFVFVGYSTYRIWKLVHWVESSWDLLLTTTEESRVWYLAGFGLASINLLMFSYNLFVFLLLRLAPCFLDPTECPSPHVTWKGELVPVLIDNEASKEKEN